MSNSVIRASAVMGTVVSMRVNLPDTWKSTRVAAKAAIDEGFKWFAKVESTCSRFEAQSELSLLSQVVGVPVPVSEMLFNLLQFAVGVAERTQGALDPTVGGAMQARGFLRNYRTGEALAPFAPVDECATYRDVLLSPDARTVTLLRPLVLDLGAVAKGMAIDLAATALGEFESFSVDAGGDVAVGSRNAAGAPWAIGIRHPREPKTMIAIVRASEMAVCTSATYERGEHLVDPRGPHGSRDRRANDALLSATVVAPSAMVADALSTAGFVLGAAEGLALLEREGVQGLLVRGDLSTVWTTGFPGSLV